MASRDISKNQRDIVRITPTRYADYDLIDIRIFTPNKETKELVPTRKGISIQVDLIPELIDGLIWALGQPCEPDSSSEEHHLSGEDANRLAQFAWAALEKHGSPVHWDSAERMILEGAASEFSKWDLHYVLATRKDLFERLDNGCYRARAKA